MKDINIEKIMDEIRADIKAKGYTAEDLRFDDIPIKSPEEIHATVFDPDELKNSLEIMNARWRSNVYAQFPGNAMKRFVKRAARKVVRAAFHHAIVQQEEFNKNVAKALNQLNLCVMAMERQGGCGKSCSTVETHSF